MNGIKITFAQKMKIKDNFLRGLDSALLELKAAI